MDHLDADKLKAVERYMLGDLSVSEVEEFERHFFDCPQCSEELRALTLFQENARAVFVEQDLTPVPPRVHAPESAASWWRGFSPQFWSRGWAVAMAALVVGVFAGYQTFTMREAAVEEITPFALHAEARGEETVVSPSAASKSYEMYFDNNWDGDYSSYRGSFRDESGTEKLSQPVTPKAAGKTTDLLIRTNALPSGKYVLVLMGRNGDKETELARFPYTLKIK